MHLQLITICSLCVRDNYFTSIHAHRTKCLWRKSTYHFDQSVFYMWNSFTRVTAYGDDKLGMTSNYFEIKLMGRATSLNLIHSTTMRATQINLTSLLTSKTLPSRDLEEQPTVTTSFSLEATYRTKMMSSYSYYDGTPRDGPVFFSLWSHFSL